MTNNSSTFNSALNQPITLNREISDASITLGKSKIVEKRPNTSGLHHRLGGGRKLKSNPKMISMVSRNKMTISNSFMGDNARSPEMRLRSTSRSINRSTTRGMKKGGMSALKVGKSSLGGDQETLINVDLRNNQGSPMSQSYMKI